MELGMRTNVKKTKVMKGLWWQDPDNSNCCRESNTGGALI